MKALKITILLTALFAQSLAFAGNCDGGSCTGGGNVLDGFLISDYAKPASAMPHFDAAERYLKLLDERVPDFAAELRGFLQRDPEQVDGVQWYLIPPKIRELPSNVTHLHFKTDQPMYQVGKEIFVSEADTQARDPELMGRVYLQDLLEMAHPTKDGESVRKLLIYLKAHKFAPPQDNLANILRQLGFGEFETKREADKKLAVVKEFQKQRLSNFLYYADEICHAWLPVPYFDGKAFREHYKLYFGVSTDGGFGAKDLDPRLAPILRDYMIKYRNKLWQNDHFASLHAAIGLPSVNLNIKEQFTRPDGNGEIEMSYWYAGYVNRLAVLGDITEMKSRVSPEAKEKIAKYEAKYRDFWSSQRVKQACADVEALKKDLARDANDEGALEPAEPKDAGETNAR